MSFLRCTIGSITLAFALGASVALAAPSHVIGGDVFRLNQSSRDAKGGQAPSRYSLREIFDEKHLAELGQVSAQFNLGVMYTINERFTAAEHWYHMAALRGHREASYNLGVLYLNGQGVLRDDGQASRWFQRAAERGLPEAQYQLGRMCYEGRGVPRDPQCELQRYRESAEGRYPLAQHDLAVLYHLGEGVAQDEVEAFAWFSAADASGFDSRDALAVVGATLTPEQRAAAAIRAARYVELYARAR